MTVHPTPPEHVRIKLRSGREIPVDTVYVGPDADGLHRWETAGDVEIDGSDPPTAVLADLVPAHTAISVPVSWFTRPGRI